MLSVLVLGVGLALLAVGLRGKRVNIHPVCRRCRFDLVGVFPQETCCPECGGDLDARRAIRIGHRRRSRLVLALAVPVVVMGAGGTAFTLWTASTGFVWQRHAPAWLLEQATAAGRPPSRAAAVGELARRQAAGELSEKRVQRLLDRALAVQSDLQRPWLPEWGEIVDTAHAAEILTESQLEAYLSNAFDVSLEARARMRSGDDGLVWLSIQPTRCGRSTGLVLLMDSPEIRADGEVIAEALEGQSRSMLSGLGSRSRNGRKIRFDLSPGYVELSATPRIQIGTQFTTAFGEILSPVEIRPELTCTVEVVPLDQPLVELLTEAVLDHEMRAGLELGELLILGFGERGTQVSAEFRGSELPLPYGFDAFVRDREGTEHRWTSVFLGSGGAWSSGASGFVNAELPERATVVLRASERALLDHSEAGQAWGGEMVFEDVPVRRPD